METSKQACSTMTLDDLKAFAAKCKPETPAPIPTIGDALAPVEERLRHAAANPDSEREALAVAQEAEEEAKRQAEKVRQTVAQLAATMGRRYAPDRASLDTFVARAPEQKAVLAALRDVVEDLAEFVAAGRGLIFHGHVGTGKDHLLAAMLYEAAKVGVSCRWIDGQDFFRAFRDGIEAGKSEEPFLRELAAPDVLAISDALPDAKDPTWQQGRLKALIDRRYREMRSTWITCNALTAKDANDKLSSPVFDRLRDGAEWLACSWPSWRGKKS